MKLVSILFDYVYNDADVIAVPDSLYDNIQELGQQFALWQDYTEQDYEEYNFLTLSDGTKTVALETVEFVHWLNKQLGDDCKEKVKIVEQHVRYRPELKTVVF